ncbi:Saccharopine dehydrogenase, NADP-dependent [Paenibacillus uliginis N3/975]|uniref:Saccharopine dehydrogenase, NADP-dependent n=1 Tax=Paenibacillus uliginis N3/975 TaxID=1313296 RepID=A0A1X7HL70_9BACL|nr:saccharopine dehydrogenase NADP-binding domain-containing protein [Paenibacillus uliginis]SMF88733.1 Saccharopine dehydrogenase, NADP-dependent [Paenibacillus uliginis N3/975]
MKDKIVVIGGYGQVGQVICSSLGDLFPGKVYAAGRSFDKAARFAATTGNKVIPIQLDAHDINAVDLLEEGTIVVMCLDQDNTNFVERCLQKKIHYIDISASHDFLSKVRSIEKHMTSLESTSVLSVGLAPGLTNMLVKQCVNRMDQVHSADIFIMLGLGEQHGHAAIEWMVDNIASSFSVVENGVNKQVRSLEEGKTTDFPGKFGRRTAYRFNFSDQHVLPETLGISSVSTRICFDSSWITRLIALMKKLGVYRSLQYPAVRRSMINLLSKFHLGTEVYAAKVSANGINNAQSVCYECSIHGQSESFITGKTAAFIAKKMYLQDYRPGIFHTEELFEPMELFEELKAWATFEEGWKS